MATKKTDDKEKVREARKKTRLADEAKAFAELVAKVKKDHSKEELLARVSKQPDNYEIAEFMAARKALDEMKVPYSKSF
ncbi:hypothetical protein LCGC14_1316520 [marine sediment metagenome]|uniref:Uncharacterized protein n=1 Tax=marine sediment metagenome TaxID=412755 RepID=A0A0F9KKS8_9ZZZZ